MSPSSQEPLKKRKHEDHSDIIEKSHKKSKKESKDKKGKGKDSTADGEFKVINASIILSVPPRFAMNPMAGVQEMLDTLIMRYVPALKGVMLCHSNARFLSRVAVIKYESPFANCTVGFDATVWSPQIGMSLIGKINLCSPDHVSLLVHQTFNVSIPRHHIPTDNWEFEYGPAENDPEFGPHAAHEDESGKGGADMDIDETDLGNDYGNAGGVWIHSVTGEKLGGDDRFLQFTVVGLTIANQMLSLVGSIQPDPLSPKHVPTPAVIANTDSTTNAAQPDNGDEDDEQHDDMIPKALESSDEEDPFDLLRQPAEKEGGTNGQKAEETKEVKLKKKREKKEGKQKEVSDKMDNKTDADKRKPKKKAKESQ